MQNNFWKVCTERGTERGRERGSNKEATEADFSKFGVTTWKSCVVLSLSLSLFAYAYPTEYVYFWMCTQPVDTRCLCTKRGKGKCADMDKVRVRRRHVTKRPRKVIH